MIESKRSIAGKSSKIHTDLARLDAHVIQPEEFEDIPELTDEWFAKATFHIGGKPIPRGRPKSENPKEHVNLRLDRDVLAHFRAHGAGWQSRINAALRKVAKLDRSAKHSSKQTSGQPAKRSTAKAIGKHQPRRKRA
jgi:uncharacterized protein (DUF4415 family)